MENEALEDAFRIHVGKCATVTPDGQVVTFEALHRTVKSFAAKLRASGIGPGAVVAPFTENPVVFHALVIALLRVGATVVSVSNPDIAFGHGLRIDFAITLPDRLSLCASNILFDQSWFGYSGDTSVGPDGRLIMSSSGTTGEPKYYLADQSIIRAWIDVRAECYDPYGSDTLATLPVFSSFGLYMALQATLTGGALFRPAASAAETLRALSPQQPLDIMTTPAFLSDFMDAVEAGLPLPDKLRAVLLGGSPVSRQFAARAEAVMGCPVYNFFGSTETGGNAMTRPSQSSIERGLVGTSFPRSEFRFVDDKGNEVPDGTEGFLAVRAPEKTRIKETLVGSHPYDGEGWFRSGDMGFVDAQTGDIILTGRITELINSSGSKVAPSRYETLTLAMIQADEVVAFGIPNALGSEDVGIAVVSPETIDTADLEKRLKQRVGDHAGFIVRQLTEMPANPTGKPDKAVLREIFANG